MTDRDPDALPPSYDTRQAAAPDAFDTLDAMADGMARRIVLALIAGTAASAFAGALLGALLCA